MTKTQIDQAIKYYNNRLPHSSVDMLTPKQEHHRTGALKKHWRWYWKEKQEMEAEKIRTIQWSRMSKFASPPHNNTLPILPFRWVMQKHPYPILVANGAQRNRPQNILCIKIL